MDITVKTKFNIGDTIFYMDGIQLCEETIDQIEVLTFIEGREKPKIRYIVRGKHMYESKCYASEFDVFASLNKNKRINGKESISNRR